MRLDGNERISIQGSSRFRCKYFTEISEGILIVVSSVVAFCINYF